MSYEAFQNPALKYVNPSKDSPASGNKISLNKRAKEFKDVSLAFTPHPITNDLTIIRNDRAINNAVKNLIMYHFGDVPFQSDIGSNVSSYLFENVDAATASFIEDEVQRIIEDYEPRVIIEGEANNIPFQVGESNTSFSYDPGGDLSVNRGYASINQYLKETDRTLGVYAEVNEEANSIELTVIYMIVGYNEVFTTTHILYPTRV